MARWGCPDKPKPPRQGRGTPSLPLRRFRPALDRNNAFSLFGRSWRPGIPDRRRSRRMPCMQERPSAGLTGCRQIHARSELSLMNSAVMRQGASKSPAAHGLADGRRPERTLGGHARPGRKHGPSSRRAAPQRGDGFPLCFTEHNALPLTSSRMASYLLGDTTVRAKRSAQRRIPSRSSTSDQGCGSPPPWTTPTVGADPVIKPNPSRGGEGKPRVSPKLLAKGFRDRHPGCRRETSRAE